MYPPLESAETPSLGLRIPSHRAGVAARAYAAGGDSPGSRDRAREAGLARSASRGVSRPLCLNGRIRSGGRPPRPRIRGLVGATGKARCRYSFLTAGRASGVTWSSRIPGPVCCRHARTPPRRRSRTRSAGWQSREIRCSLPPVHATPVEHDARCITKEGWIIASPPPCEQVRLNRFVRTDCLWRKCFGLQQAAPGPCPRTRLSGRTMTSASRPSRVERPHVVDVTEGLRRRTAVWSWSGVGACPGAAFEVVQTRAILVFGVVALDASADPCLANQFGDGVSSTGSDQPEAGSGQPEAVRTTYACPRPDRAARKSAL